MSMSFLMAKPHKADHSNFKTTHLHQWLDIFVRHIFSSPTGGDEEEHEGFEVEVEYFKDHLHCFN